MRHVTGATSGISGRYKLTIPATPLNNAHPGGYSIMERDWHAPKTMKIKLDMPDSSERRQQIIGSRQTDG